MGLSAWAEWILNFVQEIAGESTDQQGSWSTKHMPVRSFLIFEGLVLPKKNNGKKLFWSWDCLHVLNGSWTLYKR